MRGKRKSSFTGTATAIQPQNRPVILYVGYDRNYALLRRRRLAGISRCAKAQGWDVSTLPPMEATPERMREELARLRPVGCVVECWLAQFDLPPKLFGEVPVVYFNPPERREWRGAASMECDETAVGQAAFEELSASLPPSYAVVARDPMRSSPWARKRIAAFRACCRKSGSECLVFPERNGEDESDRIARIGRWTAALPQHCAIFAVNDSTAAIVANALAEAGRSFPRSVTLMGVDAAEIPADGLPASTISSVKLDFELSGYLAAKAIAFAANEGPRCARNEGPRKRERKSAACAANEKPRMPSFASQAHSSFGGNAATLHCGAAASSFAPEAHPSLVAPPLGGATFGPLFVERRQSTRGRGRREPWVLEAVEAIRREACDGLTAASLAKRFPVSRKLFELRFREAIGHSVLNEILHVRMERVFDLLARRDFPIGAIADFCGFDSARELRSLFRKRTGISMREWRNMRL